MGTTEAAVASALMVISSDGHAGALMKDYRPYLDPAYRNEFDAFLADWNDHGARNIDLPALQARMDREHIEEWTEKIVNTGRVDGYPDPHRRLEEMEREGVAAEVLFPDFGIPFELYPKALYSALGYPMRDEIHKRVGMQAFNRWLADFVSVAPERLAGLAAVSWQQGADTAVADIRAAHSSGLKGIVLPEFDPEVPLYHPDFEAVWDTLEELEMVVTTHTGISSTSNQPIYTHGAPHPACAMQLYVPQSFFFTQNILLHLIWGGVLERHPGLKVSLTEQGSGWVVNALRAWDYARDGSYFRTDHRDVIPLKPSEYFQRQCFIGSSIFSRAEIAARADIGIDKMMLGMDFPHHEGTLIGGTKAYLQATLGAENVPIDEARQLLALNAAAVFGFDVDALAAVAARIGPRPEDVLTPPSEDLFPKGDVHRPFGNRF